MDLGIDGREHLVIGSDSIERAGHLQHGRKDAMNKPTSLALSVLLAGASFLLPKVADAIEQKVTIAQVSFHISHPAKEYDAKLLTGGATATAYLDATDMSKTRVEANIKVEYFNSSNNLRDSHMMEVLEGIVFPEITWKAKASGGASGPFTVGTHELKVKGPITVHGVTKELEIPIRMKVEENGLVDVTSKFSISLEDFEIERPSLVLVKIADEVPIKVRMVFPAGPKLLAPPAPAPAEAAPAESETAPTEDGQPASGSK